MFDHALSPHLQSVVPFNGANLKMDTIKDGSFGSAAAAATAWKCFKKKQPF